MKTVYLPGVDPAQSDAWAAQGAALGLKAFNPTLVDWNTPAQWRAACAANTTCDGGAIMEQWGGYIIVCLFGLAFSLGTYALIMLEGKFANVKATSEHYNTAGRDVKTGLTAAVIVSQWTWAATLLQSSNVAWKYGVSGPFWYAAGATIQVLLFGVLSIEIKSKAPNAHTFLELIEVRWGKAAHMTFLFFGILTNLIVTSMLLLGGAAVMNALTGMDIRAASFLIPLGVLLYTYTGGLKATFLASYLHTAIIMLGLVIFVSFVYLPGDSCPQTSCAGNYCNGTESCNSLGSAPIVYERLRFLGSLPTPTAAQQDAGFHQGPVTDNRGGSYLTMLSMDGFMFGLINIVGNFGTVFVDQSYWQSAIAASPGAAHKGYLLGGLVWFAIPFSLATSLGLAANALNVALTSDEAGDGLVPPAAAVVLMGDGGGVLVIIMLFMAITSTGSAEAIAVSSLFSYDVYRKYLNPKATTEDILRVSKYGVIFYCCFQGFLAWMLWGIGLGLGWVYNFMGVVIGSAVPPVAMVLLWDKCTATAAMTGAWGGQIGAVITWLVVAANIEDPPLSGNKPGINLDTTGNINAQLGGCMTSILLSMALCYIITKIQNPEPFDWNIMREGISLVEKPPPRSVQWEHEHSAEFLADARAWIMKYGVGGSIFLVVIWPLMTLPWGVFSESLYSLWASVALAWGFAGALIIVALPIYENIDTIQAVLTCTPINKDATQAPRTGDTPVDTKDSSNEA